MTLQKYLLVAALTSGLIAAAQPAHAVGDYDEPVAMDLVFKLHVEDGIPEQDIFIERAPGADRVYRPTEGERDLGRPLFATRDPVAHSPFDPDNLGPWAKGQALDITLGQWLAAEGQGSYSCADGEGTLSASFTNLVPGGVYTMWHYFLAWPPTEPFIGTYDLPVGSRDGAQATFHADTSGRATYRQTFKPCLQLTGEHLAAGLAIAWHSDGKTYGVLPGGFGSNSHIQLYVGLPKRSGL